MAESKDTGELSESFKGFVLIIVVIAFVLAFWDAFKAGKIMENTASSTPAQTVSQDQTQAPVQQNTNVFSNGSVQYQGQTISQPPVQYSNSPVYNSGQTMVPTNQNNCGSVGGQWTPTGTCVITDSFDDNNIQSFINRCAALDGTYNSGLPQCFSNEPCPMYAGAPSCTVYYVQQ